MAVLQLPQQLSRYDVDRDFMVDMRTGEKLTAEKQEKDGYVSFVDWFQSNAGQIAQRNKVSLSYAGAVLAQSLCESFMQEPKQ